MRYFSSLKVFRQSLAAGTSSTSAGLTAVETFVYGTYIVRGLNLLQLKYHGLPPRCVRWFGLHRGLISFICDLSSIEPSRGSQHEVSWSGERPDGLVTAPLFELVNDSDYPASSVKPLT